jgi:hypothetical protein
MSAVRDQSPVCVIPGCQLEVSDWGHPCRACLDAFGPWLRVSCGTPLNREEIVARDAYVERAYVLQQQTRQFGARR